MKDPKAVMLKVLKWIGYGLFFLLALVLFVRFTFPTNQARELVKSRLAEATGAERVELADLGITGLFPSGVTLEGLEVELPPIKVKTPERGVDIEGPTRRISVEELSVSGSLMGLASGSYDVEFDGKVQGGEIAGGRFVQEKGGPAALEVAEIKGVELGAEGLLATLTGFDIVGTLGGKVKLDVPATESEGKTTLQLSELTGEIELELSDAQILQPIIDTVMQREQVRMAFTDTRLGTVRLRLKAEGGAGGALAADAKAGAPKRTVIDIEEITIEGGDIEVAVAPKATITMLPGQSFKDATINVHLAVKINDAWFDIEVKDPKDPTKMTKPNVGVRTMLTMGPLKNHVQDGQFGIGITGNLKSPKVQPERPRTRVGGGGAGVGGGSRKLNVDQPGGEDEGDEEGTEPTSRAKRTPPTPAPAAVPGEVEGEGGTNGRAKSEMARPLPDRPNLPSTRPGLDATNRPLVKPPVGGRNSIGRPRPKIGAEPLGGGATMPEVEEPGEDAPAEHPPEAPSEEEAPAPELEPLPGE